MADMDTASSASGYATAEKVMEYLDLLPSQLDELTRSAVIPPPVNGLYHFATVMRFYVRHLHERLRSPVESMRQAKLDMTREQLRAKRLANDAAEGLTLPVDEVVALLGAALEQVRDALLGQAERLAQIAPETPHAVIALVDAQNRATLERLSQTPLPDACRARLDGLDGTPATGHTPRLDA